MMKLISSRKRKDLVWGYFFIAPLLIGFIVFIVLPVIVSLYYSFTDYNGITKPVFNGLSNYKKLLRDKDFIKSLINTIYFTVGTVSVGTVLSLLVSVAMCQKIRGKKVFTTIFFLPNVISTIAVSLSWQWLYNTDYGFINTVLGALHLYQPPWLTSEIWAMPSVMIMTIWKTFGFNMLIFIAGIMNIPRSYYEAAEIDGAGVMKQFFHITVPLLKHTTFFVVLMGLIGSLQAFDQIYIMTKGGPAQSTSVVVYLIYMNAFQYFKQGYASAMAYFLFAVIFIITIIRYRANQKVEI